MPKWSDDRAVDAKKLKHNLYQTILIMHLEPTTTSFLEIVFSFFGRKLDGLMCKSMFANDDRFESGVTDHQASRFLLIILDQAFPVWKFLVRSLLYSRTFAFLPNDSAIRSASPFQNFGCYPPNGRSVRVLLHILVDLWNPKREAFLKIVDRRPSHNTLDIETFITSCQPCSNLPNNRHSRRSSKGLVTNEQGADDFFTIAESAYLTGRSSRTARPSSSSIHEDPNVFAPMACGL